MEIILADIFSKLSHVYLADFIKGGPTWNDQDYLAFFFYCVCCALPFVGFLTVAEFMCYKRLSRVSRFRLGCGTIYFVIFLIWLCSGSIDMDTAIKWYFIALAVHVCNIMTVH